jgi:hypothetical protein
MSNLSQFGGGGVKSVQRGVITLTPAGVGTGTATITAVDINKSVVFWLGSRHATNDFGNINSRVELTNSTTVTAAVSGAGSVTEVGWQVVEFF